MMRNDQSPLHQSNSIRSRPSTVLIVSLMTCCLLLPSHARTQPENVAVTRYDNSLEIFHPVRATGGMVASEQNLASQVGADILSQGGNAIDAAVAVGFALAVVLPNAGNLGGGGFMLIRDAKSGETRALDFRETAPAASSRDMFLDQDGKVIPGKSTRTPYSVAVPGTVAGLIFAAQQYGTLPLNRLLAPAIKLAEDGFIVSPVLAQQFSLQRAHLERWPSTREVFFKRKPDSADCPLTQCPAASLETYAAGERLLQPDLARTLRLIARHGTEGFKDAA